MGLAGARWGWGKLDGDGWSCMGLGGARWD